MSVRTAADDRVDEAKERVAEAIGNLGYLISEPDTWGMEDFSQEYRQRINQAFDKLREVRELLGGTP